MKKIFSLLMIIMVMLAFNTVTFAVENESESEVISRATAEYVYNDNIYANSYSDLITLSGSKLTSYYSVGTSDEIEYVTIYLYRESSPSAAGRTLIASKKVYAGTSSTLFLRDKDITPGANYRIQVSPHPITEKSPIRVIVSLVSW